MKTKLLLCTALVSALTFNAQTVMAEEEQCPLHAAGMHHHEHSHAASAPISIMGDHTHHKGGVMLSYRYMDMQMEGNRNGTNKLSPLEISGDFANVTGSGPATLRIVPTKMNMKMHMLGAMAAPNDDLTLMLMVNYLDKKMSHKTFSMMNADMEIGGFTTRSEGWGDTKLAALFDAYKSAEYGSLVAKAGISLPTGALDKTGTIFNPMGNLQDIRLPYAMQLGSGTYDLEPALTYKIERGAWSGGSQYRGVIRIGENSENYTLGDKHTLSLWGRYGWNEIIGTSLRLSGEYEGDIDGRDTRIAGTVQTANPDWYGGKRADVGIGFDLSMPSGALKGHSIAGELSLPVYQNVNGVQMDRDYAFTLGYKAAF